MATDSDVFISYAADTKPLAEELARALQRQGMESWAAFKDLQPGQNILEELERAIATSRWLLFVIGPNSLASRWQEAEWRAALASSWEHSEKKMLPVVVGGAEPPPFLRNWVSLNVDPATEPVVWTHHVLDVLRSAGNRTAALSPKDQHERQLRMAEIGKAAEALRTLEPEEPPVSLKA
jgi:hypothetical protein